VIKEKDQIGFGVLAFILGIVGLLLIFLNVYFMHPFLYYLLFYLPLSVLAMIFSLMSYWGRSRDKYIGLIGGIVGFLIIPIGLIWVILS